MVKRDGYVVDAVYPQYFYRNMQPLWLSTVLSFQGLRPPDISAPFSYCELGCGSGLNLVMAAALNPQGRFMGVDFNPRHVALGRESASALGLSNIEFVQADFQHFAAARADSFDFIACHGTWSWVSPSARRSLLQIVQARLKPQGVLYLHYMCHPGSTPMLAVQVLFRQIALEAVADAPGAVRKGLALVGDLLDAGLFEHQPELLGRLRRLRRGDIDDLAHDLLAEHWTVDHSVDIHRLLSGSGACFVGSAEAFENMDPALSVPDEIQAVLAGERSAALRETLKDLARRQQQRCDLFQRSAQPLAGSVHLERLRSVCFRVVDASAMPAEGGFETPMGRIGVPAEAYAALFRRLAGQSSCSFDALLQTPCFEGHPGALLQAVQLLMHAGVIHPVCTAAARLDAPALARLERWLQRRRVQLRVVAECATALHVRGIAA